MIIIILLYDRCGLNFNAPQCTKDQASSSKKKEVLTPRLRTNHILFVSRETERAEALWRGSILRIFTDPFIISVTTLKLIACEICFT